MMYYIGTKEACESYNQKVKEMEGYKSPTNRWANIRKHPTREEYAIVKHAIHASNSLTESELDETWNEDVEI